MLSKELKMKTPYNSAAIDIESGKDDSPNNEPTKQIPFMSLSKDPMFMFGLCAQFLAFGSFAFGQPTLALYLIKFEGIPKFSIGLFFALPAFAYILNSLVVPSYCDVIPRKGVIFLGLICFTMSLFLIGASPFLGIESTHRVILTGLMILGFSLAMISVPLVPEVIHSLEIKFP